MNKREEIALNSAIRGIEKFHHAMKMAGMGFGKVTAGMRPRSTVLVEQGNACTVVWEEEQKGEEEKWEL